MLPQHPPQVSELHSFIPSDKLSPTLPHQTPPRGEPVEGSQSASVVWPSWSSVQTPRDRGLQPSTLGFKVNSKISMKTQMSYQALLKSAIPEPQNLLSRQ